VADVYRNEDAVAALSRLRQDNAELRADIHGLQRRLEGVERRAGLTPALAPARKRALLLIAGVSVLMVAVLAGVAYRTSYASDYLRTHPQSATGSRGLR
jgi:hypothetical protein